MKQMLEQLAKNLSEREPGEGEYLNAEDGLIYCANCHKPRQRRREVMGVTLMTGSMCDCDRERRRREEEERSRQDFLMMVEHRKNVGLHDRALRACTFANDQGFNPEIERAHVYVAHWANMLETNTGLLLWGGVGTGKTFMAGCIANALLERGVNVMMTNFSRIINALSDLNRADRNAYIDGFDRYDLLIIDDLGVERDSPYALEQVFSVVDSRYRSQKPMIVTTNLTLEEMKHPANIAHARIYDRVLERCVPIRVNHQNIRALNAGDGLKRMRKMFEEGERDRESHRTSPFTPPQHETPRPSPAGS